MPMSTMVTGAGSRTPSSWPVPEERRTVTVLFADIVGSTALVDRLDPEDVRALQRVYFDTVAGVLHRWHGVVEKYIGDAVMALFGARESDGFDAYRAVRAGLEIQRALDRRAVAGGPVLRIRVGVATGEAVVDLGAAHDGGHGAASGAVITTAARLQEYAPPGGVVLCAATHRATAGLIDQRPVPPLAVAGKALPVDVWHAIGAARPAAARHEVPLIGRRRELATARDQIVRAVRERSPWWLSLVGPAGSGRSRLLHELSRAVGAVDGVPVRWCVTHCPPYPEQALAPVAELVRGFAGLRAANPPAVVRRRLTAALTDLVPPAHLAEAVYALEGLLAAPDGGTDAARGATVWQEVLLALADRQPVVVAVDDLDRAAPELVRFLHRLFAAARTRGLPLVVVALHGPEWADPLPDGGPRRYRLAVRPLRTMETGRLLRHLLVRADRPAALVDPLLPLVHGNPGRAVAYVASVGGGETDPARPPVPETVRRVVEARLDRLDGAERAVLMAVAALGPDGTAPTVERLLDWAPGQALPVLRALAARGLLEARPAAGHPVADPVVREVAYARLPRAVRTAFTRRATVPAAPAPARNGRRPHRAPAGRVAAVPTPGTDAAAPSRPTSSVRPEGRPQRVRGVGTAAAPGGPTAVPAPAVVVLPSPVRSAARSHAGGRPGAVEPVAARHPGPDPDRRPSGTALGPSSGSPWATALGPSALRASADPRWANQGWGGGPAEGGRSVPTRPSSRRKRATSHGAGAAQLRQGAPAAA